MLAYNGWDLLLGVFIGLLIVPLIFSIEWLVQTFIHWLRRKKKSVVQMSKYIHAEGYYDSKANGYPKAEGYAVKNENICVYCGASIPEGRLVCKNCEDAILKN